VARRGFPVALLTLAVGLDLRTGCGRYNESCDSWIVLSRVTSF